MCGTLVHSLDRRIFMTEYSFDKFEDGPPESLGKRINVTINNKGYFFVNRKAILAMGEPDAVVLMFDQVRNVIGMKRSPIERKNAFRLIRRAAHETGRMIYCANFCRHHKIVPAETIRFADPEVNKDGILILDLNQTESGTLDRT
jgi:hypothetical protein